MMLARVHLALAAGLVGLCLAEAAHAQETAPVQDRVPVQEEPHIRESLVAGRIADVLRNECGSLNARMLLVLQKLEELKQYAIAQGYTEEEVKAFLKDNKQKAKLRAEARRYLAKAGAVEGDEESYCRVGRDEIAKGTLAGSLLWSW